MVNTTNNWFEMYNQDQAKHIKIKRRRKVKKVKKDELPATVEGIYMREAVMALIHSQNPMHYLHLKKAQNVIPNQAPHHR